jgi:hypothetical protein
MEIHGNPWTSMEIYVLHGNRGNPWKSMDMYGNAWKCKETHGYAWKSREHKKSEEIIGNPRKSMEMYGRHEIQRHLWKSMDSREICSLS